MYQVDGEIARTTALGFFNVAEFYSRAAAHLLGLNLKNNAPELAGHFPFLSRHRALPESLPQAPRSHTERATQ